MPFFGLRRVQSDYFNSSLMTNLFVMADISRGENKVRRKIDGKGEGRTLFTSNEVPYRKCSKMCIGRSGTTRCVHFDPRQLCGTKYKRVMIIYLIPGHSLMIADRVVAWVKRSLTRKDIFIPCQLLKAVDGVKSVDASFIDHESSSRPCFKQWDTFLGK